MRFKLSSYVSFYFSEHIILSYFFFLSIFLSIIMIVIFDQLKTAVAPYSPRVKVDD